MFTPLTINSPPVTVRPVTTSKDAVNVPPVALYIVKLLSLL
jgi:hypothetical protein